MVGRRRRRAKRTGGQADVAPVLQGHLTKTTFTVHYLIVRNTFAVPALPHAPTSPPPAADWLALDAQLCFALYASSLAMTKLYKPLLAPLGLTYPQYLVLLVLWEADAQAVGTIGERLGLDSGTLTPLLKRLEAQGLVRRERDAEDERRVRIHLTDPGRTLRTRAAEVPRQILCATSCTLDEVAALTQRLHALRAQLSRAGA